MNNIKSNNLLLIIDPQNDFVNTDGSLYIEGAEKSIKNLCEWIRNNKDIINNILITQDTHTSFHISHSMFWESCPEPFTNIKVEDLDKNKTIKKSEGINEYIKDYIKKVEDLGRVHTIWPDHCIQGSWGWCFPKDLVEILNIWTLHKRGCPYEIVQKGLDPWKESYSVFSYADGEMTEEGLRLIDYLKSFEKIYVAGFAKDYCVAYSIQDLIDNNLSDKLIFLNDCMATIDKDNSSLEVFNIAKEKGAKDE